MSSELGEGLRGQIVALSQEGMSQRQIAAKVEVSKGAVQRTLKRYKDTGSFSSSKRSGRPKVTMTSEDYCMKLTSLQNTGWP